MMDRIEDQDLGTILIKRSMRAKHITARRRDDVFVLTVPTFISDKNIISALSQLKPKLLKLPVRSKHRFIEGKQLPTLTFSVNIERNTLKNIYHNLKEGVLYISVPQDKRLESEEIQHEANRIVEAYLRIEAKKHLPGLVQALSKEYNFEYKSVSIQKSKTRWGSCSSTKKINLSYWCLLLPRHLVEFVILHELCHTVEMNHGSGFWALLDSVTNHKAKELTNELKACRIEL